MLIVVHVGSDVARDGASSSRAADVVPPAVSEVAARWGVAVQSMPPDLDGTPSERQFTLEVSDPSTVEHLIAELRTARGVDAVYAKPADELP